MRTHRSFNAGTRRLRVLAALFSCAWAVPLYASFHLMQIEQVIGGVNGDKTAQAVQLRMRSTPENLVSGCQLIAFDAAGNNPITLATFSSGVSNGAVGSRILITTASFASHETSPITSDFTMTAIPASYLAAGRLAYLNPAFLSGGILWSVSWGGASYTGPNTGLIVNDADGNFAPPFAGVLPSGSTSALLFPGLASALSTNNAADYMVTAGTATFTNNAGNSTSLAGATPTPTATPVPSATPTPNPTPTPTPTPTATNTPTPTATATDTPTPTPTPGSISISGAVTYCSNPAAPAVPGVTITLTGTSSGTATTDALGNYTFSSLVSGGTYTVTPTKTALTPGSTGINTVDVIATQRHFLNIALLSGCRLTAADVNLDSAVNTVDVIAIQRFFLGLSTGIANVGRYQFSPMSRSYPGVVTDQTAQNYDTLVYGDVATSFVYRPEGPSQDAASDGASVSALSGLNTSAGEVPATVVTLSLPNVAVDAFVTNFNVQVTTSPIAAKNKLVGFQGDFTFDERVVAFQSEPVRKAGVTGGNCNVSGNVLAGTGPIRTLRISAYSNDFTPLSGTGTLFELRMSSVSKAAQGTQLLWAAPPDNFIFIDADLNTQKPGAAPPGSVTQTGKRK